MIALIAIAGFRLFGSSVNTKIEEQAGCVATLDGSCSGGDGAGTGAKQAGGAPNSGVATSALTEGATGTAQGAQTKGASAQSGSGVSAAPSEGATGTAQGAQTKGASAQSGSGASAAPSEGATGTAQGAQTKGASAQAGGSAGGGAAGGGAAAAKAAFAGMPGSASAAGGSGTGSAASSLTAGQSSGPSFDSQVRGTEGKPIDGKLAEMAANVYGDGAVDGWNRLTPEQLQALGIDPASLKDPSTGFTAAIFTDGQGRYVLAFAGSNEMRDWQTNFTQGLGFNDAQYNQAVALAQDAKQAFGDNLVITGHSLGGGLAATAALATNSPAVTYNAAGVNNNTIERLGLDPDRARSQAENGQIRRYSVEGEILTHVQEHAIPAKYAAPDAVGRKIVLNDPNPLSWKQKLIPGARTKHRIDSHGMDAVTEAMREDPQW